MTEVLAHPTMHRRGTIPIVLWPLFLMGIIATLTIMLCFYWLTSRLDQVASEGAYAVTNVFLEETIDQLRAASEDYSFWNVAYEIVTENDTDQIYDNLGSGAAESDLFDKIILLNSDLTFLDEFQADETDYASYADTVTALQPFLSSLQAIDPQDFISISGIADLNGSFAAVTAVWVTPDYIADIAANTVPIFIGIVYLDTKWTNKLAKNSLQSGHEFLQATTPTNPDKLAIPLKGLNGQINGTLSWDQPSVGTKLRHEILPSLLVVCLSILVVSFGAAGYFNSQHKTLQNLKLIASTDPLTGILNRAGLDQIAHLDETTKDIASGHAALIYLDLNDFKKLNDQLGHKAGDMALQVMAQHLQKSVRKTDIVARIGGDEFVCLIQDEDPKHVASQVAERIQTFSSEPIKVLGVSRTMSPSIGVAVATTDLKWDALLSQADSAMYWAKRNRSLDAAYYTDKMDSKYAELAS